MSTDMSKGFLIFAENSSSCDYVEQAYALALSIKASQQSVTSVSIMTNNTLSDEQRRIFDNVIEIPWITDRPESKYKAEHRWKLYYVSPYDETIVLDADMLILDDITSWWDYCSNYEIKFCSKIKNYKLETIKQDVIHRRAFIDNGLTNPYFALHYFKKSETATEFYKTLEFVCNNWEWAYTKFAPIAYQNWLSMDLASAISIEILGYYESVIDECSPLEFIHMKPAIQDWPLLAESWQDTVPFVLNSKGDLVVGNIKQPKVFHYVEKNFITKKILAKLKELAHE
jgi:hypothetical protein